MLPDQPTNIELYALIVILRSTSHAYALTYHHAATSTEASIGGTSNLAEQFEGRSCCMPSAGGSVRGLTAPQYSAPPEYTEPNQAEPEYAAVDDSAPVPAAPGLAYTDMASPLSAHTAVDNSAPVASEFTYTDMAPPQAAHAVDDDEEL